MKLDFNESTLQSFKSLFAGNATYRISVYQRYYSWEKKQVQDFWNDFKQLCSSLDYEIQYSQNELQEKCKENNHFLGTIITTELKDNEYQILDGQQRLTTIFLLSILLVNKYDEISKYQPNMFEIAPSFKKDIAYFNNEKRLTLKGEDDLNLQKILESSNPFLKINSQFNDSNNFYKAYKLLERKLNRLNLQESLYIFKNMEIILQESFCFFRLNLKNTSLAEWSVLSLFRDINTKGKPISFFDELRISLIEKLSTINFSGSSSIELMNNIDTNIAKINELMYSIQEIISLIKSPKIDEKIIINYFCKYMQIAIDKKYNSSNKLALMTEVTPQEFLEKFIKNSEFKQQEEVILFVDEIVGNLLNLVNSLYQVLIDQDKLFYLINYLKLEIPTLFLLVFLEMNGLVDDEFLKLLELVDLKIFKVKNFEHNNETPNKSPKVDIYTLISKINENKENLNTLNQIKLKLTSMLKEEQGEFEYHIQNDRLYTDNNISKRGIKFVLWCFYSQDNSKNQLFSNDFKEYFKNLEIEHFLPKAPRPTSGVKKMYSEREEQYKSFVDGIENLGLLTARSNRKLGDTDPMKKIEDYQKSKLIGMKKMVDFFNTYDRKKIITKLQEMHRQEILNFIEKRFPKI